MARAAAPALQLAQLRGLQHMRGLHLAQTALIIFLFNKKKELYSPLYVT